MSDTILLEAALEYAKRGWLIIPCKPRTKLPLTANGIKNATNNEATIRAWWQRWPNANIAVACGPASGVYIVDVDVNDDEEKKIDGWKSLEEFESMPETVMQKSPRGGGHFFFKTDTPPANKNGFRKGIDIRSDGFYVMLAPSIHPNGKAYEWMDGHAPGDLEFAEFPDFMRPAEKKAVAPWDKQPVAMPSRPASTPIIERASLYLAECDGAVQGQAGHDSLLKAASALVNGFALDDGTALSLLWNEYNPRCNPPWDRSKPGDVRDFERKVREAGKSSTKPKGYLLSDYGLDSGDKALEYGRSLAEGLLASRPVEMPQVLVRSEMAKISTKAGDWSASLFSPPGYVGQLHQWIDTTAGCPQPKLSVLASIVAAGALFGGKVMDESSGRTNIFAMGVAPSSAGKDHPFKAISRLFEVSGAEKLIGGGSVTSDSALEVALTAYPIQLFGIDEAGDFLSGLKNANGSGAAHLSTIKPALKRLWSSADGMYKGKQKADEEVKRIMNPHVCLWALTTPGRFYEGVGSGDLEDGFVARMMFAISDKRESYRFVASAPPPEYLISTTQSWLERKNQESGEDGDIRSIISAKPILVATTEGAWKVFRHYQKIWEDMLRKGDDGSEKTAPIWGKGMENARRVALALAAGDEFHNPEVQEAHAHYACLLTHQTIIDLVDSIKTHMSDNAWEADKKKILKLLIAAGPSGISRSDLIRRTQWLRDRKTRESYIADMAEASIIVVGKKKTSTRPSEWIWAHPYGLQIGGEE
jgi:hypothetical protein